MNITSALIKINGIRLVYGDKWLFYSDAWVVYQRKYGTKKAVILCRSEIQDDAVKILISDTN